MLIWKYIYCIFCVGCVEYIIYSFNIFITMLLSSEVRFIRNSVFLSAIFGQFPVQNSRSEILVLKYLSPCGLWAIFLFLAHIFLGQSFIASVFLITPHATNSNSVLDKSIILTVGILYFSSLYTIYLVILYSTPKLIDVYNKRQYYDSN